MSLNYNFIWLLCYLLVLVGLAGYGFHRLSIVYLYWKNRNNKPPAFLKVETKNIYRGLRIT